MFLRTKVGGNKKNLLIIRFQRYGHKHNPIFAIILAKQGLSSAAGFIEKLGYYNPRFKEQGLVLNSERLSHLLWLGIPVNNTVRKYLVKFGNK